MMLKHGTISALALILAFLAAISLASCGKKEIISEPGTTSTEEEDYQLTEEEAGQMELEQQSAVREEDLSEGSLSAHLEEQRTEAARHQFENEDIYFEFDSVRLSPDAQEVLTQKAVWLRTNSDVTATIEGHCDSRGTNEYNLALGEGRAQSVKAFLVDLGIDGSRLTTISYGEERPVDRLETEAAWARNRRASFVIR